MKLLITGAAGFLGRYTVAEALRRGHSVRALVRSKAAVESLQWASDAAVEIEHRDLRERDGLESLTAGVDSVLHLAAAHTGDLAAQQSTTIAGTENLVSAMTASGVRNIVLVSSFSVYDFLARRAWSVLDEQSPLATAASDRDAYGTAKRRQETIVSEAAQAPGWRHTILRPGAIYGPGHLWTPRLGFTAGDRWWFRTGRNAPVPLVYVEHCAEAVVRGATDPRAAGQTLNVVDDDAPSQRRYMHAIAKRTSPSPRIVPIPWTLMRLLARSVWLVDRAVFRGRLPIPSLLVPAALHARCKPMRYSNDQLHATLDWTPRLNLEEALDASIAVERSAGADSRRAACLT